MRFLNKVDEFKQETTNALFTKEQALAVTIKLFDLELADPSNSEEDIRVLTDARQRVSIQYFDSTATQVDEILDSVGVARLTAQDIAQAIDVMLFESK